MKIKLQGSGKAKTPVKPETLDPVWNFDASFELNEKSIDQHLTFELFDDDRFTANDFLGHFSFPVEELVDRETVAGYFDLMTKEKSALAGGEVLVIITVAGKMDDDARKELLNSIAKKVEIKAHGMKAIKPKTKEKKAT
jgi:Ca2+-dependent lipid-binding protein